MLHRGRAMLHRWNFVVAPLLWALAVAGMGDSMAQTQGDPLAIPIVYLTKAEPPLQPLSLVEPILEDEGLAGAQQALADNNTTGRFLGHEYELIETIVPEDGDLVGEFQAALDAGQRLFVADLHASQLLEAAGR